MKILIVMGGFFPGKKYGGPPVSVDNFCALLKENECYIITKNHDKGDLSPYLEVVEGWNDRGNCKVQYVSDSEYKKAKFEAVIKELHPDIIYLQGLFQSCVFPCLWLAKKHKIPVLLAPRGELCAGALNIKKYKKIPYIKGIRALGLVKNIHWQSTSDEETEAIKKLMKASDNHIHRLDNIPSIPKKDYPRKEKIAGEGRFVFLSRIHPKKNLLSAIKCFHSAEGKAWFDIYGPIEEEEYWKQCQEEIKRLPENVKVEYKGLVDHAHVHEVFSHYDAFLFPTLSENYGHVIAESLIAGTPVIISDQTPWNDINEYKAGWALPLNSEEKFVEAINQVINSDNMMEQSTRSNVQQYIDKKLKIYSIKMEYEEVLSNIADS